MEPLTVDRSGLDDAPQRPTAPLDCAVLGTRGVNCALQAMPDGSEARILQPRGRHNLAVGVANEVAITVEGNAGYFLGGLCGRRGDTGPHIVVNGFVGWSVGENLMGGLFGSEGARRRAPVPAPGAGASLSRGMRHFEQGSHSRAARWPSQATPGR